MGAALSLIPELEKVLQHGARHKRVEALRRITALFLAGAGTYNDQHVEVFDDVFSHLIAEIESKARAELANRLAPVPNAPARVLRTLAHDDDIAVAGPVLKLAPRLAETDLLDLAHTKSQAHLQALSMREDLGEAVTDVLVRRGNGQVARNIAGNRAARISESAFFRLIKRAESDGMLAEKVGLRPDIPPQLFKELLTRATAVVQQRLLTAAPPDLKAEIHQVLKRVSDEVSARVGPRDYRAAQRVVLTLHRTGQMDEAALAEFAVNGKYEETVAGLAALSKVPIHVVDRLMAGEQPDPILILSKATSMSWPTVKAIISLHPDRKAATSQVIDTAFANYERLSTATAQRVVRFWQFRPSP